MYLRQWAKDTHTPILSVDYSLAPELPFPRQLEEVFFAYCWAMKNAHLLGKLLIIFIYVVFMKAMNFIYICLKYDLDFA